MECQAIEIIRSEMLAYASRLPQEDVQRLIALLHRGSISQIDSTDVLGKCSREIVFFLLLTLLTKLVGVGIPFHISPF